MFVISDMNGNYMRPRQHNVMATSDSWTTDLNKARTFTTRANAANSGNSLDKSYEIVEVELRLV